MSEKKYDFYSYIDYLHHPDFLNQYQDSYSFIKKLSARKFNDKDNLKTKEVLELVAKILCLFQYIPHTDIDSIFDKEFGHNTLQKARLSSYFSDIDLHSNTYKITQSDFIINLLYLLFTDRSNLNKFTAKVFLPDDTTYQISQFDYFEYKNKIQSYIDLKNKKLRIRLDPVKGSEPKPINWINLFYIICPQNILKKLSLKKYKEYRYFTDWLATGEIKPQYQKLIDVNTNKIESLLESPKKKPKQAEIPLEDKDISTDKFEDLIDKDFLPLVEAADINQIKLPTYTNSDFDVLVDGKHIVSIDDYINQYPEYLNKPDSRMLATYEGMDENKETQQFQHSIFFEEELYKGFPKADFKDPIKFQDKNYYEVDKEYWFDQPYPNDDLLDFLRGEL